MEADDAVGVASQCTYELASPPIPDFDGPVKTASDKFGVIELQATNAGGMTSKSPDLLSRLDIPHLDSSIIRSGDKNSIIELKGHDAIAMTFENVDGTASVLPVCADLEAIFVNILPRSLLGLVEI